MLIDLLYILITLVCGTMILIARHNGLLSSIIICVALGITFACLICGTINAPTPLAVAAAFLFSAMMIYLGRCQHTAPNAETSGQ